ncbi:MAG: SMC-Scp complex subunit ScpB [Acidobacteriota bacterium]
MPDELNGTVIPPDSDGPTLEPDRVQPERGPDHGAAPVGVGEGKTDPVQIAALCEAVLGVAGEAVTVASLAGAAGAGVTPQEIEAALEVVRARHEQPGSGLVLERVAGGWRLATRPQLEGAVRTFLGIRSKARLSQAGLEALAIVAYRQPITLPEINYLRGVNSAGVLRTLVEKHLVRVAGRKQVVGTPLLYRTTKEFLVHFGLDDLAALPRLEDPEQAEERGTGES